MWREHTVRQLKHQKRMDRIDNVFQWCEMLFFALKLLTLFAFVLGKDMAMITINAIDECAFRDETSTDSVAWITLHQALYIIPISHIVFASIFVACMFSRSEAWMLGTCCLFQCGGLVFMINLFIWWSLATTYGISSQACYGVLVAWPMLELTLISALFCLVCGKCE